MLFTSKEIFVLRKVLSLANKLGIERTEDVIMKEGNSYNLELKGVKQDYSIEAVNMEMQKFSLADKKAFLRGVFLGCGILSTPPSYHLELRFETARDLLLTQNILQQMKIKNLVSELRVFIKGRENIKRFLFDTGAQETYIFFEEDAVKKELANMSNRKANFEYANLERQTASSSRILPILEKLRDTGKLEGLREDLREVAILKLSYPLLPLSELAEKSRGRFSKQGVYYRLKRIESIYGR